MGESPAPADPSSGDGELSSEDRSTWQRWMLLEGDRHLVALGLLAAVFLVLGAALLSGIAAVRNDGALARFFSALIAGNLTLITVVIAINQLILSQEFAAPDELQDRVEKVVEYRHDVEQTVDAEVSPVTPDQFLDFLADAIGDHAERLREETSDTDDRPAQAVAEYAETLVAQSDQINAALERRPANPFDTLLIVLDTDFTSDVQTAQQLRRAHEDSLSPEACDRLDDVLRLLQYTGVARQYFKTLHIQRELATLSQKILYMAIPVVATSVFALWLYGHPSGAVLSSPVLESVVLVATVAALGPLALLVAYILRITTITRRTASLLPFKIAEESPI